MRCERGVLRRADGSARYSQDLTSVLVAVYGPCEVKKRREELDRATIEVIVRPRAGVPGVRERELEASLQGLIEPLVVRTLHPRTAISIVAQVVQDDGALAAALVNGTAIALMDAGVPMRGLPSAVTVAIVPAEGDATSKKGEATPPSSGRPTGDPACPAQLLLDPTANEEACAHSVHTIACVRHNAADGPSDTPATPAESQLPALLAMSGTAGLRADALDDAVSLAQGAHGAICLFARRAMQLGGGS